MCREPGKQQVQTPKWGECSRARGGSRGSEEAEWRVGRSGLGSHKQCQEEVGGSALILRGAESPRGAVSWKMTPDLGNEPKSI